MKIIVIPDVHLKPWMFERASVLMDEEKLDGAVCLMDLPDDWGHGKDFDLYIETYDAASRFAAAYPETKWCWGNHDLSYKWGLDQSGYSSAMQPTVRGLQGRMVDLLPAGNPIRYVQRIGSVIFSHGGLSDLYVREAVPSIKGNDVDGVIDRVNSRGARYLWNDESPIWLSHSPNTIRPSSSMRRPYSRSSGIRQSTGSGAQAISSPVMSSRPIRTAHPSAPRNSSCLIP